MTESPVTDLPSVVQTLSPSIVPTVATATLPDSVLLLLSVPSSVATAMVPVLLCLVAAVATLLLAATVLFSRLRVGFLPTKEVHAAAVYTV